MKIALLIIPLLLWTSFCFAGESYTVMVLEGKETGFLKYKAIHAGIEVVALSTDIGSGWHKEDLTLYFRDKTKSRRFHRHLTIPMTSNVYCQFRCRTDGKSLFIDTRSKKEEKFSLFCKLLLPANDVTK